MSSKPLKSFSSPESGAELLRRATSLLDTEMARLRLLPAVPRGSSLESASFSSPSGPESARRAPLSYPEQAPGDVPGSLGDSHPRAPTALLTQLLSGANGDELRRRGSELLETLLASLAPGNAAAAGAGEDRVPLLRGVAPIRAGTVGAVTFRVTNEDASPSEVALYASNLIADSGYELPSLLVSIVPGRAILPARSEATFDIRVAVPAQALPGLYSGLVQARGCTYVKAVVMFEVL